MNKRTLIYLIIAVLLLIGGYFFFTKAKEEKPAKTGTNKNSAVPADAIVAHPATSEQKLTLSGSIDAEEKVEIRSEITGRVTQIYFQEGQRVQQGQVLLKTDDTEIQAQLREAQTTNQLNKENERRALLLFDRGAISQEEYDIASAAYKTSNAQIQLIQAQLAKTAIRAPFSGTIGLRYISIGAIISPTALVTNLIKDDLVKITFSVPEKYSNILQLNTKINFQVANDPRYFSATIYALEPEISQSTRTLTARAKADNSKGTLKPGSFANITLPIGTDNDAISIPTEAIVPVQDGKKVFILKNGNAKEVKVETGIRTDKDIIVLSGLKPGDTVLTTGVLALKDGSPVKITLAKES